jgi:uncharacterized protein YndB with AHSA1/START domain
MGQLRLDVVPSGGAAMSAVEVRRVYPRPVADVWAAISEPEAVARWFAPSDFRAEVGHRFPVQLDHATSGDQVPLEAEVTEVSPPRVLALRMMVGWQSHSVSFELEPVAEGTALTVRHGGVGVLVAGLLAPTLRRAWDTILNERLAAVLEEVERGGDEKG